MPLSPAFSENSSNATFCAQYQKFGLLLTECYIIIYNSNLFKFTAIIGHFPRLRGVVVVFILLQHIQAAIDIGCKNEVAINR